MMVGMRVNLYRIIIGFGLALLLTACVSTERGGVGSKADSAKALELSVQLARQYIRDRNWNAAKRHLKIAIDLDDSSSEIYEGLALVFQNTGEAKLAEKNYKISLRLSPKFSRVRNNYGAFLYQQRRFGEAAKQLEIVAEDTLYSNRLAAFENLGRCYIQLKKLDMAEQAFLRAYQMNTNNLRLVYALSDLYFQLKKYPSAQKYYDLFRQQTKQQTAQTLWLGIRLAKVFESDDALSSYVLALKNLYPTSQEYLDYKSALNDEK